MNDAAPGAQIRNQRDASEEVKGDDRDGAAGDAETRERSPAEDEARGQGDQCRSTDRCDHSRNCHVARAADHVRERVEHPDQDRPREDHIGVGQCRGEAGVAAAHHAIEPSATRKHGEHEEEAKTDGDGKRVDHQRVSVGATPGAGAIADEIPPPMAPADIICISIRTGKTSATPARASVPSLATKYVSMSPTEACTNMTSTFGVASRRSVLTIGPSSRTRVLASNRGAVPAGGPSSGRDSTYARTALPFGDITASVLLPWASPMRMTDELTGMRRSSDGPESGCRASGLAERQLRSVPRPRADGRRRGLGPSTNAIAEATPRPAG